MTAGLPSRKTAITSLAESVLLAFRLSAAMSATDAVIQKKNYGSRTTALTISNEKMEDIVRIVKSLEESGLLTKEISEPIKMKQKNKKEYFLQCYQEY